MTAPSHPLCGCGAELGPVPGSGALPSSCPKCGRPVEASPKASALPSDSEIEHLLLKQGSVTLEQIKQGRERQAEEGKRGRKLRIGEALVELKLLSPEKDLELLAAAGKVSMRCPGCSKVYRVPPPRPGTRVLCKACKVPVVPANAPADARADESGTGLQHVPVGDPADPAWTDLVPGYQIERRLGGDDRSQVFLARQKSLDRWVAIRVLSRRLSELPSNVERFLAEARAGAKLSQENLVAPITAGQASGFTYLVMEFAEGETLLELLRREKTVPEPRALEIARQVATGLAHARQQGLLHRDLRPANVKITHSGVVKILDFGFARDLKEPGGAPDRGAAHPHPAYASPEQCKSDSSVGFQSDMYSLGILLFEMLTGQPPFRGGEPASILVQQVMQAPPSPRDVNPSISAGTSALVLRLLRKAPEERFPEYGELLSSIVSAWHGGSDGSGVKRPPGERCGTVRSAARPSRRTLTLAAGFAFVILVAAGLVFLRSGAARTSSAPATGSDANSGERALAEARALEKAAQGRPGEVPAVRARWKELVERFRGTPSYNAFAGAFLEFESRVQENSRLLADEYLRQSKTESDSGRTASGWFVLRGFPKGFEDTAGAQRISEETRTLGRRLEDAYQQGREAIAAALIAEKFDEARSRVEALRSVVSIVGTDRLEYVRESYREELDAQARRIEEESLLARKRELEGLAKKDPDKAPVPPSSGAGAAPGKEPTREAPPSPVVVPAPPAEPLAVAPSSARLPVPDLGAQKASEKLIRELFREDYAKKAFLDKAALAQKLIELGLQTQGDPPGRYVLFEQAQELAVAAGNLALAFEAVDHSAKEFEVNGPMLKGAALLAISQNVRTPEEMKSVAVKLLQYVDEALALDDPDGAARAASAAASVARRAKDIPLLSKADAKLKECDDWKGRLERWKKASDALAKNPADPEAAGAAADYLCFVKNDWTSGIPLLAKGPKGILRDLAQKDQARPDDAASELALADEWWEAAERENDPHRKEGIRKRAGAWYQQAMPMLSGFHRMKAEKRMSEIGPVDSPVAASRPSAEINLLKLIDPRRDTVNGVWQFSGDTLIANGHTSGSHVRIEIPYTPPEEYDLHVSVEKVDLDLSADFFVGLIGGGRQFTFSVDAYDGGAGGIFSVDGRDPSQGGVAGAGGVFAPGRLRSLVLSVRKKGLHATLDGKDYLVWTGEWSRVGNNPAFAVRDAHHLYVGALKVSYRIRKLTLVPFSN